MKKVYKLLFLSLLSLFLLLQTKSIFAESPNSDFSIAAVIEGHQKDKNISYWWLRVEEAESIKLKLKITNGKEANEFEITSNQAVNNRNFTLDYSLSKQEAKKYLNHKKINFDFYEDIFLIKSKKLAN